MRFFFTAALAMCISCGPPVVRSNTNCCQPISIRRDFGYTGSYTLDGGASTQVQAIVSTSGQVSISFVRGTDQVVERIR